jgi:hypothetical protein
MNNQFVAAEEREEREREDEWSKNDDNHLWSY